MSLHVWQMSWFWSDLYSSSPLHFGHTSISRSLWSSIHPSGCFGSVGRGAMTGSLRFARPRQAIGLRHGVPEELQRPCLIAPARHHFHPQIQIHALPEKSFDLLT